MIPHGPDDWDANVSLIGGIDMDFPWGFPINYGGSKTIFGVQEVLHGFHQVGVVYGEDLSINYEKM